jgi:hypothetical protein
MAANHTTTRPNPVELRPAAPESRKNWQIIVAAFAGRVPSLSMGIE